METINKNQNIKNFEKISSYIKKEVKDYNYLTKNSKILEYKIKILEGKKDKESEAESNRLRRELDENNSNLEKTKSSIKDGSLTKKILEGMKNDGIDFDSMVRQYLVTNPKGNIRGVTAVQDKQDAVEEKSVPETIIQKFLLKSFQFNDVKNSIVGNQNPFDLKTDDQLNETKNF